mmetsp:Transcript_22692/g.57760  ORF Transcript_22692/g.57760 Transcript_22692/m.57760 type:complete len:459 (-) Transcript_22692:818-2194(-)
MAQDRPNTTPCRLNVCLEKRLPLARQLQSASITRSILPPYFRSNTRFRSSSPKPMDANSASFPGSSAGGITSSRSLLGSEAASAAISWRTCWMACPAASFGCTPAANNSRNLAATCSLSMPAAADATATVVAWGRCCWAGSGTGTAKVTGAGAAAGATGAMGKSSNSAPPPSERRFATRDNLPLYFSRSRAAVIQSSKPISPSSLSCAAYFLAVAAASGGGMPKARRRSKTLTSSTPLSSSNLPSLRAAVGVSGLPSNLRSRASCARSSAAAHSPPPAGTKLGGAARSGAWSSVTPSMSSAPPISVAALLRCCRKSASCRAKFSLPNSCPASAGPNSRQCPGHFCTNLNSSEVTLLSGSDSTQSSTCSNAVSRLKRLDSRPPKGNRTMICTRSAAASGSGPSNRAFARARFNLKRSRSSASWAAASSRAFFSSSALSSASVLSLGSTSTVKSVSSNAK